jgi:biopolymer transport protein ExbD
MMRFPVKKRTRPTIHLTALIDIVFLLLIFFLLSSSFVDQQGVAIIVPEIESDESELLPDIIVQIDREGVFYFNRKVVQEDRLFYLLKDKLKSVSKDKVIIQADRRVEYDKVVQAIDIAKLAGAKDILLATQRGRAVVNSGD